MKKQLSRLLLLSLFLTAPVCMMGQQENATPDSVAAGQPVKEEKVFEVVEAMPAFPPCIYPIATTVRQPDGTYTRVQKTIKNPGGQNGLMMYLTHNVNYPALAEENGIQGRVVCTFVIERDGSVSGVKVVKGVDPLLNREAMRVIKSMPKWIPGRQDGKPVRVKFTIPVSFRLK